MDIRRRVGLNVRKFRLQRAWSQEQLAFECDLHRTYVSGVERGIRNPTILILNKIATALQVSPGKLLDDLSEK
ncbi:MAG: family transcriptional regulator [Rhodospirillales bacterium]|nr:family transcriptional regulator [Rhodospirillales bacterium]